MRIAMKYGLLLAFGSILLNILIHFTIGEESSVGKALDLLGYAIYSLAIVLGILEKRKLQNNFISYSQGFGTGFFIMLAGAIITSVYFYILYKFLDHGSVGKMFHEVQKQFETQNQDQAAKDMGLKMMKAILVPGGIAIIKFIGMLFSGLIISLIAAAFLKRENDFTIHPDAQNSGFDPYR